MKYNCLVKYNGVYYKPGMEVPNGTVATEKVVVEEPKATENAIEKKPTKAKK